MKPSVIITAGDPAGIGPEITVQALRDPRIRHLGRALVIGEPASLARAGFTDELADLLPLETEAKLSLRPIPSPAGGRVSFQTVKLGAKLALAHHLPLVTAPISKQSWHLAGVPFTGHTELLRHLTHAEGLMMFVSGNLCCALVTEHFALSALPLTPKRVIQAAKQFEHALKNLGSKRPVIGLCAVNPHGGDNGQFGTEEIKILRPALQNLQRSGVRIKGPLPSDAAWLAHKNGQFAGLLCMYHDQALLGLKLAAKEPLVHVTAGLPFVRTSPAHGTAFDIVGKNQADPTGMIAAILFAARAQQGK